MDPGDVRHDLPVTVVTAEPEAVLPFAETRLMAHGLSALEGKAVHRLTHDRVEAGDVMWLRAFCSRARRQDGPARFRRPYHEDVDRQMKLRCPADPHPTRRTPCRLREGGTGSVLVRATIRSRPTFRILEYFFHFCVDAHPVDP